MSLSNHQDDLANFFTGLGLQRRASKELAEMLCKINEMIELLEERNARVAGESAEGGTNG